MWSARTNEKRLRYYGFGSPTCVARRIAACVRAHSNFARGVTDRGSEAAPGASRTARSSRRDPRAKRMQTLPVRCDRRSAMAIRGTAVALSQSVSRSRNFCWLHVEQTMRVVIAARGKGLS
jgi:hypothetical protein